MGLFDMLRGQVREHVDVENLATKLGLPADQVEGAIGALAKAHTQPGDTVADAAAETGLPTDQVGQIMEQVGGEGALARFSQILSADAAGGEGILGKVGGMLDRDGDGNPVNDIAGMAKGLFGKS